MVWGKRIYGLVDFESPYVPEWALEERKDEIARVRDWQRRKQREFVQSLRGRLSVSEPPATIEDARKLVEQWQAAGLVTRYELKGDLWLARRLAQAGLVIEKVRRRSGVLGMPEDQELLLGGWLQDCVRVDPNADIELEDIYENVYRWAKWRGLLQDVPSKKRVAAYLREQGHKSVRRNFGMVFVGMFAGKPRSLASPAANAEARNPAQTP